MKNINISSNMFRGAGVIVCKPGTEKRHEGITYVETDNAAQTSKLILSLKKLFAENLDYLSKYEFYGRLAEAANAQIRKSDDLAAIEAAMIGEACSIASEMGKHLYFAYGSNMSKSQMEDRCPDAIFAGTAILHGYSFELDFAGVATVVESAGNDVLGTLWLISSDDEKSLDSYEGVASQCYRKERRMVVDAGDTELNALIYLSNRAPHDGISYRSGYMDRIIERATQLGFDESYIDMLKEK